MRSTQEKIIQALHVKSSIDPVQEIETRVDFLKQYLQKTGARGYVLGISGGQDATLCGKLAQLAIDQLLEEEEGAGYQFIAVRLPYGKQFDEEDAWRALQFIQPNRTLTINIQPAVDTAVDSFLQATGEKLTDFIKGNTKARERMKVQYDIAGHYGLLVLGTDHAAEAVTGFFTKHGDGACDVTPLTGLSKRQGKQLLNKLGAPESLYTKVPTADLEENTPGKPDEVALGMTYEQIDNYLEGNEVDEVIREKLESLYRRSEHKRRLPATLFDDWWKEQ